MLKNRGGFTVSRCPPYQGPLATSPAKLGGLCRDPTTKRQISSDNLKSQNCPRKLHTILFSRCQKCDCNIGTVLSSIGAPSGAVGPMEDGAPSWAPLCCAVVASPWFECRRADAVNTQHAAPSNIRGRRSSSSRSQEETVDR